MSTIWQQKLKQNFTRLEPLIQFLQLADHQPLLQKPRFPLNVPMRLAEKMAKNDLDDPILRQFLPHLKEKEELPHFVADPVGDSASRKQAKLLHKYHGRALLICTSACAMNCRFCFRQNFDYDTSDKLFEEELDAIAQDSSLTEILLSGGDPLSLTNERLADLINRLSVIPHVQRLRFHTRFPIGIPERIDDGLLNILAVTRLQVYFVIHCNHANELDADIFEALKKVQRLGIPVLSQTVLLKGVNDQVSILKDLFETLSNNGIIPYYLHQLDRVRGAAHFEVDEAIGRQLIAGLSKLLPGYAIPKYVREIPGEPSKTIL